MYWRHYTKETMYEDVQMLPQQSMSVEQIKLNAHEKKYNQIHSTANYNTITHHTGHAFNGPPLANTIPSVLGIVTQWEKQITYEQTNKQTKKKALKVDLQ